MLGTKTSGHGTVSPPDWLALDAEAVAGLIFNRLPPEKCAAIVRALNERLTHWRVGSCDLHLLLKRR